jgi:hypothetical protein
MWALFIPEDKGSPKTKVKNWWSFATLLRSNSENLAFALHIAHNFIHLIVINEYSFLLSV